MAQQLQFKAMFSPGYNRKVAEEHPNQVTVNYCSLIQAGHPVNTTSLKTAGDERAPADLMLDHLAAPVPPSWPEMST